MGPGLRASEGGEVTGKGWREFRPRMSQMRFTLVGVEGRA